MERNLFVWLSGADPDILKQCTKLRKSERRKFAGFGTTVLIPAMLGLFSMGYAISTFSSDPRIYLTGGVTWFFIVLAIDRFLVSTLYKSSLKSNRGFGVALISRFIFACFVGVAVSHPLILFFFEESINQKIAETRRTAINQRLQEIETARGNVLQGETARRLNERIARRDCLQALLTAEQSGHRVRLDCGYSVGEVGCGIRCRNIQRQIDEINEEISALSPHVQRAVNAVNETTANDVRDIENRYSHDYLARVKALAAIEREEPHVWTVKFFLMIFFVFVDTLLILLKATTPRGEYEEIRDTLLYEVEVTHKAERGAIDAYASTVYRATAEAERKYDGKKDEIITLIKVTNNFIREQEQQREVFDREMKAIAQNIKSVKDEETRKTYVARLTDLRNTFNLAWGKALTRFQEYLKGL